MAEHDIKLQSKSDTVTCDMVENMLHIFSVLSFAVLANLQPF